MGPFRDLRVRAERDAGSPRSSLEPDRQIVAWLTNVRFRPLLSGHDRLDPVPAAVSYDAGTCRRLRKINPEIANFYCSPRDLS
jgi:hypothetical protein